MGDGTTKPSALRHDMGDPLAKEADHTVAQLDPVCCRFQTRNEARDIGLVTTVKLRDVELCT